MMGNRKLVSAAPPIRGNNQLMLIVGGGGDKRGGRLWGIELLNLSTIFVVDVKVVLYL